MAIIEGRELSPQQTDWRMVESSLSELNGGRRKNSILPSNTLVDIAKSVGPSGQEQYALVIQYPFTSDSLVRTLFDFSDDTFRPQDVEESWRNGAYDISPTEQQFFLGRNSIADLLKSRDDGEFIDNLASRLSTVDEEWNNLLIGRRFPRELTTTLEKVHDVAFEDVAAGVMRILRRNLSYWESRPRRSLRSLSPQVVLGRFAQLGEGDKSAIMDEYFESLEDAQSEKTRIVKRMRGDGVTQELINGNNQHAFLSGSRDGEEYDRYGAGGLRVINDIRSAGIFFQDNGRIVISPQSGTFHIPYLQWEVDGDERKFVIGKPPIKTRDTIMKPTSRKSVFVEYKHQDWQTSDPVLGFLVAQNLTRSTLNGFPLEWAPAVALLHQRELLESDFIKKAEAIVS